MTEMTPLQLFLEQALAGNPAAAQLSGRADNVQDLLQALTEPDLPSQPRPLLLEPSADAEVSIEGLEALLTRADISERPDRAQALEIARAAAPKFPELMALIPIYQPVFTANYLGLMLLRGAGTPWLFWPLPPELARCWDGVAVDVGTETLVISAALDAAEPYILSEQPDLLMMIRGLPPIDAEAGESCPAFPSSSEG